MRTFAKKSNNIFTARKKEFKKAKHHKTEEDKNKRNLRWHSEKYYKEESNVISSK